MKYSEDIPNYSRLTELVSSGASLTASLGEDKQLVDGKTEDGKVEDGIVSIPDGTVIVGKNFTQKTQKRGSDIILGKNLTFVNCNMNNVKKEDSWSYIECANNAFDVDENGDNITCEWRV